MATLHTCKPTGLPTGDVQSPPVLSPLLFERLEARYTSPSP